MAVTTRRQSGLPPATTAVTRSQTGRGAHGPTRSALVVPGDRGRSRHQAAGPTVGTPRQRRNDPMDEGENHEDEGRNDAVPCYGTQHERNVAEPSANRAVELPSQAQVAEEDLEGENDELLIRLAKLRERQSRIEETMQEQGFGRVSIDHEGVQRGGPGGGAAPPTPTPECLPLLCATPPWLQEPPESWYQYTPHLSRAAARFLYWGLEEEGKPLKVYSTAYQSYLQECALQGYPHPFPATLQSLVAWVSALADGGMFYKTIKIYLVDARSAQDEIGASREELELFSHPTLKLIVDGIKYVQREIDRYK